MSRLLLPLMVMLCSAPVSLSRGRRGQDAVGVDVEGDLDLRHAPGRRADVPPAGTGRAPGCRRPARAHPAAPRYPRPAGCPPRSRTPRCAATGMVVLRSMSLVITPPSGLHAQRQRGHVQQQHVGALAGRAPRPGWRHRARPPRPGSPIMFGSLPPVSRRTRACTAGIRVDPPTRITSSRSASVTFASAIAWRTGSRHALRPGRR